MRHVGLADPEPRLLRLRLILVDVQHGGELGPRDIELAGALVIPREQKLDARLVAGIDVFRLAEFHQPAAQDVLRPRMILWRALRDVRFGGEKQ